VVSYYDYLEFLKDIIPEKVIIKEAIEKRRRMNEERNEDYEDVITEETKTLSDLHKEDVAVTSEEMKHKTPTTSERINEL
jgi:phosphoserine phosphatase